jgi:RNA recognition motif-containing protein
MLYRKAARIVTEEDKKSSCGYGYVEMETLESAKEAIAKLNNCELDGKKIRVSLFIEPGFLFVLIAN